MADSSLPVGNGRRHAAHPQLIFLVVQSIALAADLLDLTEKGLLPHDGVGGVALVGCLLPVIQHAAVRLEGQNGLAHAGAVHGAAHADAGDHADGAVDALHFIDIDHFVAVPLDQMDCLACAAAQPLHGVPGQLHHVQILLYVVAQLADAHSGPVYPVAHFAHIAPRRHGRQHAVDGALVQAGDLGDLMDRQSSGCFAQQLQQRKGPVQGLYPLFFHGHALLCFII